MSVYQVMPDLTGEEYEELKEDIAQRGVMVPIEYDEHGNVLDGHHRLKACAELGIADFPRVIRAGMSEQEKRTHARKLNMARRHLTREQKRGMIWEQLTETLEKSDRQIASGLGVSDKTVGSQRRELEGRAEIPHVDKTVDTLGREQPRKPVSLFNPTPREEHAIQNPSVLEKLASGAASSAVSAHKLVMREEKAERKNTPFSLSESDCWLLCADIRDGLPDVPDDSVDFVITDPPYPKEYIPLYESLSLLASRVLKDGGSLLCMCGQSYLNEVMLGLCTHMTYHWTLCYFTPGGQSPQLWGKRTNTFWKPIVWLTKGKYDGDMIGDVIRTPPNENDKMFHEWGQSIAGLDEIIQKFTYPGQTILDPFMGGGTTAVCAVKAGRRFIGADISNECVETVTRRISEVTRDAGS